MMERNREKLMYYPAASKNHHAVMSGLLFHMKRMLVMGKKACEVYTNLDPDWVVTGVVIHDMEKINEILSNNGGSHRDILLKVSCWGILLRESK